MLDVCTPDRKSRLCADSCSCKQDRIAAGQRLNEFAAKELRGLEPGLLGLFGSLLSGPQPCGSGAADDGVQVVLSGETVVLQQAPALKIANGIRQVFMGGEILWGLEASLGVVGLLYCLRFGRKERIE